MADTTHRCGIQEHEEQEAGAAADASAASAAKVQDDFDDSSMAKLIIVKPPRSSPLKQPQDTDREGMNAIINDGLAHYERQLQAEHRPSTQAQPGSAAGQAPKKHIFPASMPKSDAVSISQRPT